MCFRRNPPKATRGAARRFRHDRRGSTAIEFSILVIPFILLVFAILESSISFAAQQVMTNAADDVARLYRTGQVRTASSATSAEQTAQLREMICSRMQFMVSRDCPGLSVDLRSYDTFAQAAASQTTFRNGDLDTSGFGATAGGPRSKNMLRVYYRWPIITDLMRQSMSTIEGGKTLHYASVTWQNEPFPE